MASIVYSGLADQLDLSRMMLDITNTDPEADAEVQIRYDGGVVWVNFQGVCVLRICGMKPEHFYVHDQRKPNPESV